MDDPRELETVAGRLEALGNATRLEIYRLLVRAGPEGLAVGQIQAALGVPGSTLNHHLTRLLWVGLIGQERHGRRLICAANCEELNKILAFLQRECCEGVEIEALAEAPDGALSLAG